MKHKIHPTTRYCPNSDCLLAPSVTYTFIVSFISRSATMEISTWLQEAGKVSEVFLSSHSSANVSHRAGILGWMWALPGLSAVLRLTVLTKIRPECLLSLGLGPTMWMLSCTKRYPTLDWSRLCKVSLLPLLSSCSRLYCIRVMLKHHAHNHYWPRNAVFIFYLLFFFLRLACCNPTRTAYQIKLTLRQLATFCSRLDRTRQQQSPLKNVCQ